VDIVLDFTGKYSICYGYEHRRLADEINVEGFMVLRDYISRFADEIPRR
jgi:hypothetical protein